MAILIDTFMCRTDNYGYLVHDVETRRTAAIDAPDAKAIKVALDMRGFSHLTRVLHDTQYLADLIGEYLTEMTEIIEAHRGVVFQYTGDGLLAIFLPELSGSDAEYRAEVRELFGVDPE